MGQHEGRSVGKGKGVATGEDEWEDLTSHPAEFVSLFFVISCRPGYVIHKNRNEIGYRIFHRVVGY